MGDRSFGFEGLRAVADYQFGAGAGSALFPRDGALDVERSRSGRPRQITSDDGRVATFLTDGRLSLGVEGGRRLIAGLAVPAYRVVVGEESEPFVREGKNAFAKFVHDADPSIRSGDEVLVVTAADELLGVGRAELSAEGMLDFGTGMAVLVREGER